MTDWNPNATATLGLEWMPVQQGAFTLDAINKMTAVSLDQIGGSIGIGTIQVPNVGIPVRGGSYAVEVYDNETAVPVDSPSTLIAVPNEDVTDGGWTGSDGNNVDNYALINEGAAVDTADYIRVGYLGGTFWSRFNTATLSLTNKRILAVRLKVNCVIGPTGNMTRGLQIGGLNYSGGAPAVAGPQARATYTSTFSYNPNTRKPWTIADVQALDSTDQWWVYGATQAGVWSTVDVYSVWLEVVIVTENRLAVGTLDDVVSTLSLGTPTAPTWNTATVVTPTGAAWTKDGAGRHLYTVRRITSAGAMSIPYLDALTSTPDAGRGWVPTVDATYGYATAMGSAQTRLYPFVQRTTVPADHIDSQPYALLQAGEVYSGRNAQQEVSGAAAAAYGVVRFLVKNDGGVTDDLDVKVRRRSDSVQLGTTYTFTNSEYQSLPDLGDGWKQAQVQLGTAATLALATQYYVEFSSTTSSGAPWSVRVPHTSAAGQVATFGGTTDAATFDGAESTNADLAVTLSTIPVAPASMTTVLGSQAVSETVNCVVAIPRADLSWAVTALAGLFSRYEIQRSEDAGATWTDIAYVTTESVNAWKDYEAVRGTAVTYRIRVVRNDGAFSAWRNGSASVTKPLLAGTGAYAATMFFVSNYNPTQNLAYEYRPGKNYTFAESDEQVRDGAFMRDYHVAANPLENRGLIASWIMIVGADDKVPIGGGKSWFAFDPLRELARAIIPYVCALDHRGSRLFCQLRVPQGNEDSTGGADLYLCEAEGAQVTDEAFVVTVTA